MTQHEIFDGPRYLFTVPPSEDPFEVLEKERKLYRKPRLSMIEVSKGQRRRVDTVDEEPIDDEFTFIGEDEDDE